MHDLLTPSSCTSMPASLASRHLFLIVENPGIADMMTWALELAGYRLTKGKLSTLSQIPSADPPAVILLDVGLLHKSGSQTLAEAQAQCAAISISAPIIILTTSPVIQKEMEDAGYRALLKPFHVEDLTQTVRDALGSPLPQKDK